MATENTRNTKIFATAVFVFSAFFVAKANLQKRDKVLATVR